MYAVMATMKLQRERLKGIEAKPEAVNDFDAVIELGPLSYVCGCQFDQMFVLYDSSQE